MHGAWSTRALLGVVAIGVTPIAWAQEAGEPPVVELCGWTPPGLGPESGAGAIAVDGTGYVWATSPTGLKRWDGERVRDFTLPDGALAGATWVEASGDEVVAQGHDNRLLEVAGDHLEWVRDAAGDPVHSRGRPFVDNAGLWFVEDGPVLAHRDIAGRWDRVDVPDLPDDKVLDIERDPSGSALLVATRWTGLWRVTLDGTADLLTRRTTVWGLDRFDDGRVIALVHPEAVVLEADGSQHTVTWGPRHLPLGQHHHSRYVTTGDHMAVMAHYAHMDLVLDDGTVACVDGAQGRYSVATVGAFDRDGSLWVQSKQGVSRFARPDTWAWSRSSGLHEDSPRHIAVTADRVFYLGWDDRVSVLEAADGTWRPRLLPEVRASPTICEDTEGRAWAPGALQDGPHGWLRLDGDAPRFVRAAPEAGRCWPGREGRVWLSEAHALYEASGSDAHGPYPLLPDEPIRLLETSDGVLLVAGEDTVCSIRLEGLRAGGAWACEAVPEGMRFPTPIEVEPGEVWASTATALWERREGSWRPHPLGTALQIDRLWQITPSERGGAWLSASPASGRVAKVDGTWQIVETLGPMQGLDTTRYDVWSDEGHDLWVNTSCGLARVRAPARELPLPVPRAVITEMLVADRLYLPAPTSLALPPSPPTVILRVASLSSKAPGAARYRLRVDGGAWSAPAREASLQLVALASGSRQVEVEASLDGQRWSAPASLHLDVAWPWYQQTWFLAAVIAAVLLALYGTVRGVVWVQVRLERQRARIAMDLHDELGAGLGSIRILAALASRGAVPADRSRDLSGRIERNAQELATALTDIVWSLRPASGTLEALVLHLVERGRDLFDGNTAAFRAVLPASLPAARLALPVSRHAQLIVTEALQNAARHSGAQQVELRLEPAGRRWVLVVADDGVGLDNGATPRPGGGSGLAGMRARAKAMGAKLEVSSTAAGTTVRLVLPRRGWLAPRLG